jgi:hypothetical protein
MIEIKLESSSNTKTKTRLVNPTGFTLEDRGYALQITWVDPDGKSVTSAVEEASDMTVIPVTDGKQFRLWEFFNTGSADAPDIGFTQHSVLAFNYTRDLTSDITYIKPISLGINSMLDSVQGSVWLLSDTVSGVLYRLDINRLWFSVDDENCSNNLLATLSELLDIPGLNLTDLPLELIGLEGIENSGIKQERAA